MAGILWASWSFPFYHKVLGLQMCPSMPNPNTIFLKASCGFFKNLLQHSGSWAQVHIACELWSFSRGLGRKSYSSSQGCCGILTDGRMGAGRAGIKGGGSVLLWLLSRPFGRWEVPRTPKRLSSNRASQDWTSRGHCISSRILTPEMTFSTRERLPTSV